MNNSLQPWQQLELQTWISPLGVRFWDELDGRFVSDGLSVTAYPTGQSGLSRWRISSHQAFINRSGVYVLRNLPGLGDFERGGAGSSEQFLAGQPVPTYPFTLEVIDTFARFQPFSLPVDVPTRGLYTWTCEPVRSQAAALHVSSPPIVETPVPLFSAPTRGVDSGVAVIRATLWDVAANLPAAWAVLEAAIAGRRVARGFADSNGQVALFFPSPSPAGPTFDPSGPPLPGGTTIALTEQTWSVQLQAYYSPGTLQSSGTPPEVLDLPDICAILQQAPASMWSDAARTSLLTEATLRFGQELVVRSSNTTPRSVVLISQAA